MVFLKVDYATNHSQGVVAHWLEDPTRVTEVVGSIPAWDSEVFHMFHHQLFHVNVF